MKARDNTVAVIEHNFEVIETARWVIDLGPEGGDGGGRIVAQGTPEEIAACATSHTERFMREALSHRPIAREEPAPAKKRLGWQNAARQAAK